MWGARPKVVRRHRPDRSRRWCRLKRPRARLRGQAAVDEQADAEADAATAEQEAANPAELQIVDSGWFAADKTIETPGVLPDSAYYYSYVAGSTADSSANSTEVVKPATVEFSITTPEGSWEATDQKLADVYAVQDGGATDTQFGAKEFTGTVTASESLDGATQSRVDVVLLDKDGKIEGGYFKIVDTEPGQAADYDIYAVGAPQYASYAVYASPWPEEDAA